MLLSLSNSAEGGTNGTAATSANSGGTSGNAFDVISLGTGGSATYSNTVANGGSLSYNLVPGASSNTYLQYNVNGIPPRSVVSARAYFYFTANASAAFQIMRFTSPQTMGTIGMTAGARFITQSNGITLDTAPTAASLNTWYRLELSTTSGATGTSDGLVSVAIYVGDGVTSPFYSYATTTATTGVQPPNIFQVGKVSNAGTWVGCYIDDVKVQDTDYIGPTTITGAPWITA